MFVKKSVLSAVIALTLFSFCIVNAASNDQNAVKGYNFPARPKSSAWVKLGDHSQRLSACQIPENILRNMTTDELVETVLDYPLIIDLYAYDNLAQGYQAVKEQFNGLAELASRPDVATKLLAKYKKIEIVQNPKRNSESNTAQQFKLNTITILLGQTEISQKLDSSELYELEKEAENKNGDNSFIRLRVESTTYSYVTTPRGTQVSVQIRGEELTPDQISENDQYVRDIYPGTTLLRTATTNYNCHSYAWYSQSPYNRYWINDPSVYMSDGSYTYMGISNAEVGYKVYYSAYRKEHSGIVTARSYGPIGPNAYNTVTVTSKWGSLGLVQHSAQDCPYYTDSLALQFYR